MKPVLFLLFCFLSISSVFSQTITGTVKVAPGIPLAGALVTNEKTKKGTATYRDGEFSIEAEPGDNILIESIGYGTLRFTVTKEKSTYDIILEKYDATEQLVTVAMSPKSVWIGAKVGYNFEGDPGEEFVGAAKVTINAIDVGNSSYSAGIIGNIADFVVNDAISDESKSKLQNLTLSVRGLAIGLYGLKYLGEKDLFRLYATSTYRLNTYKNVGDDSSTVNISQFRNSVGFEFEGLEFKQGGKLNVSIEGSIGFFDKAKYKQVFADERKVLTTFEISAILPLSKNIGFFVNGSFSKGMSANYITGIIIQPK